MGYFISFKYHILHYSKQHFDLKPFCEITTPNNNY